ncbi:MAG: aminotransferase class V-fold PLP-dependent enzyme [Propionibacteriales bacterium]|nr:aminotransferase class V-fold PLP-dependent enzyme [Propionibacteriales bacterium]
MIDIAAEQALTPASRDQVFLDSAGSSLPTDRVVDTVVAHLRREARVGGYRAAQERADDLAGLPVAVGRLLGCAPDLLAFSDSATRSWSQFVTALPWAPGDRILICGNEYASNAIALLQRARHDGVVVEVVPTDPAGDPDLDALAALLDERVRLVSLVQVATNSGHVTRVAEATALAHQHGALVLLDACQSVGQLAVDVEALGVDALSATGRKWLRGPRGTGFLYVRREVLDGLEPPAADMRGATWTGTTSYELNPDATRFELWENDVAGRLGLGAAVDHLLELGPANVEAAVRERAAVLRSGLGALAGVRLHDVGTDLGGIVTFTVDGRDPLAVRDALREAGVTVSVSVRTSTRLDMTARGLDSVVRASPHYFVSDLQLEQAVGAVAAAR